LPPKLASGQNQDLGLAAQTGPKGALTRAPSGHPRFLTARYRSLAIFQRLRLVPQTPPLRGTLISDSNLLEKILAVSHHSFDVVLKAARDFLVRNLTADCYLKNTAKFG
jgi:hypothetical protein